MISNVRQFVIDYIKEYNMINTGESILIGVSGGADSVCLLSVFSDIKEELGISVSAVHVNHMLRGEEAERDKAFVKKLCAGMRIPCTVVNADVNEIARRYGLTVEEAGRNARYAAFAAAAKKINGGTNPKNIKVAVAHNKSDNAETVILNLVRGSGLSGLKGILPVSSRGNMTVIRPLLGLGRDDIEGYLNRFGIPHVEDSTNAQSKYARNKIRNEVLPLLEEVNSKVSDHINDTAMELAGVHSFIDRQIDDAMQYVVDVRDDSLAVSISRLCSLEPVIMDGIIYKSIGQAAGTFKDISRTHVKDVESLKDKQTGRRIELPYGIDARRSYSNIIIGKRNRHEHNIRRDYESGQIYENVNPSIEIPLREIENGGKVITLADGWNLVFEALDVDDKNRAELSRKNLYTKAFDYDTIKGNLILGRQESGDQIKFAGGTKTLKKYFADEKIPLNARATLPVLKDEESVLWVIGYRIGEPYKITSLTKKAVRVSITEGNNEQT